MKNSYLKKQNSFLLVFALLVFGVKAQVSPLTDIDSQLRRNADAVIRNHETVITIVNESKALVSKNITVSVFDDDESIHHNFTIVPFDQHTKITELKMEIYDAQGKLVDKIKKNDFLDASLNVSSTLFSDHRALFYDIHEIDAPYTFVIQLEYELKQLMALSAWAPVMTEKISLESGKLTIEHSDNVEINSINYRITEPEISSTDGVKKYTWTVQSLKSIHNLSSYDRDISQIVPMVRWVPLAFEFGGIDGGFSSWQEFSAWLDKLSADTKNLSEEAKRAIHNVIDDDMTKSEKVKAVYAFLQDRSRYVSIQLGIGGWKPFTAEQVHETQYGDCKALSNYTQALLKEVGVESHYAVIFAGRSTNDYVDPAFPSNSFNHAVVLVPIEGDTVLLECTSQEMPCGYKSAFTDDRYAMLVDANDGRLIKTLGYSLDDNIQIDSVFLEIDIDGFTTLRSKSTMKGLLANHFDQLDLPASDQKKWLVDYIDFGQFDIADYELELREVSNWDYELSLSTELTSKNFATSSGNRIFIPQTAYHRFGSKTLRDSLSYEFNIRRSYQYNTSVHIFIPEGYVLESELKDQVLDTKFGSYSISYFLNNENRQLTISRHFKLLKGKHDKDVYRDFRKFKKRIYKIENEDIVLVKKM